MRSHISRSVSFSPESDASLGEEPTFHAALLSRRRFLTISAATAGAAILAACGGDDDDAPAESPATTATQAPSGGGTATETAAATAEATTAVEATATESSESTESASGGGIKTFRSSAPTDIQNMDPATITTPTDYVIGEAIYNYLVRYYYDPPLSTELTPELAESWEISDDATSFTFNIISGAKYHNGNGELTASDIKWNWERIQNPDTASRYRPDFDGAVIEAPDDQTVTITFDRAYPAFMQAALAFRPGFIVSPAVMQELGDAWKTGPIGTGPFRWGNYEPGSSVLLVRNEEYWGPQPKVDQILMKLKVEENSGVLAVATGELDQIYITTPDIASDVLNNPDPNTVLMQSELGQSLQWLAFNMTHPPFDDIRVRQALRYAIDVEAIANDLFGGLAQPVHSFLPPYTFGYSDDVTKFLFEPDRAIQMLEEASDVIPDGWNPVIITNADAAAANLVVEVVASYWADVGVNAKVEIIERGVFEERRASGDYDVFAISSGFIEADQMASPYWRSGARINNAFYEGADDLIDQAKSEPNPERRLELYRELQDKISIDSPAAFTVATLPVMLLNKRVSGIVGAGWGSRTDWFNVDVPAE